MQVQLLMLPGDGIGPEIAAVTRKVLAALAQARGLTLTLDERAIGFASLATKGSTLPDEVMERIPQVDGVILGRCPISSIRPVRRAA